MNDKVAVGSIFATIIFIVSFMVSLILCALTFNKVFLLVSLGILIVLGLFAIISGFVMKNFGAIISGIILTVGMICATIFVITIPNFGVEPTSVNEVQSKYCTECGSNISVDDNFCNFCGKKLKID